MSLQGKHILVIITGSIAAYKMLDVMRECRRDGAIVRAVLTHSAMEFITPLSVAALTEQPVYTELFSLKDETDMGHIRLSREADIILIAPASASMLAKMATGQADDLAGAIMLATDATRTPVLAAPAMNPLMWQHPATQRNIAQLRTDGVRFIEPAKGDVACGEYGQGRLAESSTILGALHEALSSAQLLAGKHIIITGGSTREAIDAVRFIGNHSSGKQATEIAVQCAAAGARVTFIHGAMQVAVPDHTQNRSVTSAQDMLNAVEDALPADIFISAAAVADWCVTNPAHTKIKKDPSQESLTLVLHKTPDILRAISMHPTKRPPLVIGFAAETENLQQQAMEKFAAKGCDWLLANDVSDNQVFGRDTTNMLFITKDGVTDWGSSTKKTVATRLLNQLAGYLHEYEY